MADTCNTTTDCTEACYQFTCVSSTAGKAAIPLGCNNRYFLCLLNGCLRLLNGCLRLLNGC